jgi:hypothetical protein
LLNLAVLTTEFLALFPASTRSTTQATLGLLSKLDYAFSSLLTGQDTATGEPLPGFESGRSISTTDKVRLKGIVDRARLTVVKVLSGEKVVGDDDDVGDMTDTDAEEEPFSVRGRQNTVTFEGFENNDDDDEDDDDEWEERNIASVYEKTIGELGDVLGGPPIGIITDDWGVNGTNSQRRDQGFVESGGEMEL